MDSFELNKIIGAVLGTLLFVMGAGFLAEAIYHPIEDNGPGYALPEPEAAAGTDAPAAAAQPIGLLLASADPAQGEKSAKKCQSCHDFTSGGPNKTGPNLYDVVERPIGSHEGFAYSEVLSGHHAAGDIWSYDNLNHFLTAPKDFAPGTKMNFAGVKDDAERANIIAYLSTLSASPKPFPPAEQPAAATDGAEPPSPAIETPPPGAAEKQNQPAAGDAPAPSDPPIPATDGVDTQPAPAVETPTETQTENGAGATPVTTTNDTSTGTDVTPVPGATTAPTVDGAPQTTDAAPAP